MEEFSGEEGSFNSEEASNSVKECIQSIIGEESYRQDTVNQWTAKIVEQALTLLVKQTKSYKYIVSCAVMQKSGAGLHTANSCYWDTVTDGSCTVKWENRTMYCVDLRAEEGEVHKDDDDDDEEEEKNNKAEEKEKSEDMEGQSLQGPSQSTAEPLQGPEGVKEETLPDGVQKVAQDSGQASPLAPTEESSASSTQLQKRTTEEKPKNQPRTNRKLSLFKRLSSSKAKQTEDSAEAPAEGTDMGELPASAKGPSAGLENRDPSETSASGAQPPLRAPSDPGGRGARSTSCTLL